MHKFIYKYAVRSYYLRLYIGEDYGVLLTDNPHNANLYSASTALKVAKNAEKLFKVKFCIEMQCREYTIQ